MGPLTTEALWHMACISFTLLQLTVTVSVQDIYRSLRKNAQTDESHQQAKLLADWDFLSRHLLPLLGTCEAEGDDFALATDIGTFITIFDRYSLPVRLIFFLTVPPEPDCKYFASRIATLQKLKTAFVSHRVFLSMIQLLAQPMVKYEKDTNDKNSKHFIHFIISIVRNVLVIPG